MIRGVRARLTATIVFLVVLTAIVLGVAAYAFVDTRLHQLTLDGYKTGLEQRHSDVGQVRNGFHKVRRAALLEVVA